MKSSRRFGESATSTLKAGGDALPPPVAADPVGGRVRAALPPDVTEEEWRSELGDIAARLTESCRRVDSPSTDKALEEVEQATE